MGEVCSLSKVTKDDLPNILLGMFLQPTKNFYEIIACLGSCSPNKASLNSQIDLKRFQHPKRQQTVQSFPLWLLSSSTVQCYQFNRSSYLNLFLNNSLNALNFSQRQRLAPNIPEQDILTKQLQTHPVTITPVIINHVLLMSHRNAIQIQIQWILAVSNDI